jgi:lysophospholipase L1-like esterase
LDLKAKSTGWTIVLTAALALGLSLAPLPEALRPIPGLRRPGPLAPRLAELLLPKSLTGKGGSSSHSGDDALAGTTPHAPAEEGPPPEEETIPVEEEPGLTATAPPSDLEGLSALTRARALSLEALREKMGAQHVDIEPGCRRMGASGCEESGLAPFFAALNELREDQRTQPVRVVHLGDSLIASDHITDMIRARLQERHGSGGKGFLFVDRPTGSGRSVRTGTASEGWQITRLIDRNYPKDKLGYTGVVFASASTGSQSVRFPAEGARVAELFFQTQPTGGSVQFSADGKPLQRLLTRFELPGVAFSRFALPEDTQTLSLQTVGKVELHGLSLENGMPGIVYDTIGLPGATAEVFLRAQHGAFRAQLRHRKPSLVVLMVGGNEAFYISRNRITPEEIRAHSTQLVKWVREAVPDSACLIMSPIDAAVRTMGGELVPRRGSKEVGDIFREVAQENGCAFWDALAAMGGEGTSIQWLSAGLFNEDLVHPRSRGSDLMGHLFDISLQRAYAKASPQKLSVEEVPGLVDGSTALKGTFARLRMLEEKKDPQPLEILHLGEPQPTAHAFTDTVQASLTRTFKDKAQDIRYGSADLPDSTISALSQHEPTALDAQLTAHKPQLLVFWYGAHEASLPELDSEGLHQQYAALLTRVRAVTGAECLLIGPTDLQTQDTTGHWIEAASLAKVLTVLPVVAREAGCAYWSARVAMGGERSMLRWQRSSPVLSETDGTHLTQAGYEQLAASFVKELSAAYEASKAEPAAQVKAPTPGQVPTKAEGG